MSSTPSVVSWQKEGIIQILSLQPSNCLDIINASIVQSKKNKEQKKKKMTCTCTNLHINKLISGGIFYDIAWQISVQRMGI